MHVSFASSNFKLFTSCSVFWLLAAGCWNPCPTPHSQNGACTQKQNNIADPHHSHHYSHDTKKSPFRVAFFLTGNFIKALGAVTSKAIVVSTAADPIPDWKYDEQLLTPKQKGEKLLVRYNGETAEDCCDPMCTTQRSYYPGILKTLCCGCMPLASNETLLVSNSGACKPLLHDIILFNFIILMCRNHFVYFACIRCHQVFGQRPLVFEVPSEKKHLCVLESRL